MTLNTHVRDGMKIECEAHVLVKRNVQPNENMADMQNSVALPVSGH